MTLEGLDDWKHHLFKVWIQKVGLLLVTFYLRDEEMDSPSESNYLDTSMITYGPLHGMQPQQFRSGVIVRRILV